MKESQTKKISLAERLQQLMDEHDPPIGIKELAEGIDVTYEHTRRMVRGLCLPSRLVVRAIAGYFGVDSAELEAVAKGDRFQREYGDDHVLPLMNSEVIAFSQAWGELLPHQKERLLSMLKGFLSENAKATLKNRKHLPEPPKRMSR